MVYSSYNFDYFGGFIGYFWNKMETKDMRKLRKKRIEKIINYQSLELNNCMEIQIQNEDQPENLKIKEIVI